MLLYKRMVYPVSCTAVCYVTVITLFIKKLGWSVQILGVRTPTPPPPVVAPLRSMNVPLHDTHTQVCDQVCDRDSVMEFDLRTERH